jgi:hypothetical protein
MGWILDMDARRPLSCCARDETRLEKYISPSKKLARALLTIIRLVWKKNLKSTHLKTHKDVECFASKSSGMIATPTFLAVTGAVTGSPNERRLIDSERDRLASNYKNRSAITREVQVHNKRDRPFLNKACSP